MKFNWVTLRVRDMKKSLDFYQNDLGLVLDRRFGQENMELAFLGRKDQAKVELIWEKDLVLDKVGQGVSIGLEPENLEELVESLKAKGYSLIGPISPNPHITFYYITDPDGYTIQLSKSI